MPGIPRAATIPVLGCALLGAACDRGGKPVGDARPVADVRPVPRPSGPVALPEARAYVLALANHDRAKEGLAAVEWDEVAALAGQRHVEDMARNGFTAHWGTDGSVPEQRYTEAGGMHFVQENAACFFDGVARELDPNPTFDPMLLEQIETAFINEKPPNDGHRKNILKPWHNRLGVGLAKPVGIEQPCMAQEFVDEYGQYDELPREARLGETVKIAGAVTSPAQFGGVGLARIEPARPTPAQDLNETSTYRIPDPQALYFPKGFVTPKPVEFDGTRFGIELPLTAPGGAGRYEVSVWGKYPGSEDLVIVSLRTITVH